MTRSKLMKLMIVMIMMTMMILMTLYYTNTISKNWEWKSGMKGKIRSLAY